MTTPAPFPPDEARRLDALRACLVLDTAHEPVFDAITELAAAICEVPIALISLVDSDRQWFKSRVGLEVDETPRDVAFCAHALLGEALFEVGNALDDPRFARNPLVLMDPAIRFYAGAPLRDSAGNALGTVCVIDREPRRLSTPQREALTHLATVVMRLLEARKAAFHAELLGRGLDASSSEVYVLDADSGRFVHINASALQNSGYRFEELAHARTEWLLPELDEAWLRSAVARDAGSGYRSGAFETHCRRKDGSAYPVRGSLLLAYTGGLPLIYLILNDISEERAAEQALQASERRIRAITDNLPALVAYIDCEERYRFVNATYGVWLQRPPSELLGRTLAEVHDAALHALLQPALQRALGGRRESFEFKYPRGGEPHYVRGIFVPERNAAGQTIGVYALTHDATRVKQAEDELRRLAHVDPLTGLANRARLLERLEEAIVRARRDGSRPAVLYMDLDHFKGINDSHGHAAGDEVLREFGRRLRERLRQTDTAARVGGDEFCVVLERLPQANDAMAVAESIVESMRAPFGVEGLVLDVSASIGVATAKPGDDAAGAIARADAALYRAKAAGRACARE